MPLLNREALARELDCCGRTIQNLEKRGLPIVRVGDSPRYDLAAVRDWLAGDPVARVLQGYLECNVAQRAEVRACFEVIDKDPTL